LSRAVLFGSQKRSTKKGAEHANAPRPASTVVLVRRGASGLEVYLLKRSQKSGFFPGNYVFPGGAVEPQDRVPELWKDHLDLDFEGISQRFNSTLPPHEAIGYTIAAIRETFEEAGIFLGDKAQKPEGDLERLCERRFTEILPKGWLGEWVASRGWLLSLGSLARWAHWITPEAMAQRFDTRFFMAFMPEGQECRPDTRETTEGIWVEPKEGLEGNLQGKIPLSPPTLVTLHELLAYANGEELKREVEKRPWGEARLPRFLRLERDALIVEPWDPMIHDDIQVDEGALVSAALPVGQPFSRLWLHEGLWRPVRG
jgi:8-oxo-dGTP pyrophosphatase MutT (NUDIX family)